MLIPFYDPDHGHLDKGPVIFKGFHKARTETYSVLIPNSLRRKINCKQIVRDGHGAPKKPAIGPFFGIPLRDLVTIIQARIPPIS